MKVVQNFLFWFWSRTAQMIFDIRHNYLERLENYVDRKAAKYWCDSVGTENQL